METLILNLIPALENQPTMMILVSCLFVIFFGSMTYSFIFSLFGGYRKW